MTSVILELLKAMGEGMYSINQTFPPNHGLNVVSCLPAGISDEACSSMSLSDMELSAAEFLLQYYPLHSPTPRWITTSEPLMAYMR